MRSLKIEATETSPAINFNPFTGELIISGESYPENSSDFYEPIIQWFEEFLSTKKDYVMNFKINYFNTSSSKFIYNIIMMLEKFYLENKLGKIKWYFQEDDIDMGESGEEFSEGLNIPFEIIAVKE